jgi:hypothetical protein
VQPPEAERPPNSDRLHEPEFGTFGLAIEGPERLKSAAYLFSGASLPGTTRRSIRTHGEAK